MSAEVAISLRQVCVRLGQETVLHEIDLEIPHGEFLAIVGPSGEGKSTLLRVIAGLLPPGAGTVNVSTPPALMFQDDRLLPWRTALGNVQLPRDLGAGGELAASEALDLVGMSHYGDYFPAQLSGGMRARVALARALAQCSDILLLDEPFSALDALVRERFNSELRKLHEKTGHTTVLVTHSIREAVWLADRVAVLREGKIVAVVETKGQGRASAYTEGLEAQLRQLLGTGDSTRLRQAVSPQWRWGWLPPLLAILAALIAWYGLARILNQPWLLPQPALVWQEFARTPQDFLDAGWHTLKVTVLGGLLGGSVGSVIGYFLGKSRALERFLSPFVVASQSTPIAVLAPLLMTWLGFGVLPAILVSGLSALYPLMVATMVGVRQTRTTDHELFTTLGATPWQRLRHLEWPSALPVMLGGLRLSLSLALIGAVVWEFVSNQPGLGFLVNQARATYQMSRQFAAIALLVLLGVSFYLLVTALERRVMRHRRSD